MGAYNDDVLFIHIPKAAGWSVKQYMLKVLPDVLMPDNPDSKLPIGHVRLQDIERFTGRKPESFKLILAVVRDPYEQQLSQWQFWRDRYAKGGTHVHDILAASYPTLTQFLEDPRCDFHVWYEQHHGFQTGMTPAEQEAARKFQQAPDGQNRYEDFGGIFRYWLTVDNQIPENVTILRAEKIGERLPKEMLPFRACSVMGCPTTSVPHLNTSPHDTNTKAYYTPRAAQLVEQKAAWCFEHYYEKWLYSDFA